MDQKLSDLVNGVDREARKFASFDDFLASQDKGEQAWQKPAAGVVENSSPDSSEKVAEMGESPQSPNAVPATEVVEKDVRAKAMEKPTYIADGLKSEPLAHPLAPNVTAEEPQPGQVLEAQIVKTRYKLNEVEWDGEKLRYLTEESKVVKPGQEDADDKHPEVPNWREDVYIGGRDFARALASGEKIANQLNIYMERIEKIQVAMQAMRGVLEDVIKDETPEAQERIRRRAAGFRDVRNKEAATKKRVEGAKAVKEIGKGIKLAEARVEMLKIMKKPITAEAILAYLKKEDAIDEATVKHVETKWGGK